MTSAATSRSTTEKSYETLRNEVQAMFRKVSQDPVNQALYKAVLEYHLEKAAKAGPTP